MNEHQDQPSTAKDRRWHISADNMTICVMTWVGATGYGRTSICNADNMGDHWYINRVNVATKDRRQGLGKELVRRLQEKLKETLGTRLLVMPGGYNSKISDLEKFYKACGFETIRHIPDLVMEWRAP